MILLALGMIGDYVARNYEESKGRPLYLVTDAFNVPLPENAIARASILIQPDSIEALSQESYDSEPVAVMAGFDGYRTLRS
jgi:hypothetical protein